MSSDEAGSVRNTAEPQIPASRNGADEDGLADPWFTPGSKTPDTGETTWFLPTGREGLRPDSVTWDDTSTEGDHGLAAAGAPPWGGDSAPSRSGLPPPWEVGPWPGPDEAAARAAGPGKAALRSPGPGEAAPSPGRVSTGSLTAQPVATDPQPGVSMPSRRLLLAAGGAVVLIVVAVVVIAVSISSGSAGGCATYPATVRQAYAKAMSDLSSHAPTSELAADLGRAASLANSSAAAASQSATRTALFAMASDLDEAHADVSGNPSKQPSTALVQRLTADGTALPRSCGG
jgi:hypothetical protein